MKTRSVLSLACKLVGLVSALRVLIYLPTFIWILASLGEEKMPGPIAVSTGVTFGVALAAAWLLFRYADGIASKCVSLDEDIDVKLHGNTSVLRELFRFALKVIGAVCVVMAIRTILGEGARAAMLYSSGFSLLLWSNCLSGLMSLGIGIYLLKSGAFILNLAYCRELTGPASDNNAPPAPARGGPSR